MALKSLSKNLFKLFESKYSQSIFLFKLFEWHLLYKMSTLNDRVRTIAYLAGMDRLVRETSIGTNRWRTVLYNKDVRISTEELEELGKLFPRYRWWIVSGEVAPEIGQTSPDYDEANRNLGNQNAG
ncbi:hypothetical protein [Azomonas agilis]|uniref:hypothetical protein n=1 Tax=Azomonas agilis TaxID=116849 RepID=UPI00319D9770